MTLPHPRATLLICASLLSGVSAIAIEYRNHPGLDRVVSELKTIAQAKLLKDVIQVSFNGALSYR